MKTKIGVMLSQEKEYLGQPEAERSKDKFHLRAFKESLAMLTP